ncbi:restriction endonuclease subunit S [Microbulbifer taiwanensis]|uniref:Restriction endonuclease subunit S n=1 Tax=Microbulbifer taiwanensis TaxID=986746 RepID=A0ABW1YJM0_9GAMM|nr:restriction endonuclease subunit S [Microbulbifer taiwanensis]
MDAQQFLAEFGHIVNAPGGIAQLREMIYQLAVTGSLSTRRDQDSDVEILLADIEQVRQRLIREKKYKRIKKLENEPVQPPLEFKIPESWRWTRLLDVGEISPRNDAPDDSLVAFVPMSGIPQTHLGALFVEIKQWSKIKKGYTHFSNHDVVLAKITPCFENGKSAVITDLRSDLGIGAGSTELHVFRPIHDGVLPTYVYLFLRSPLFVAEGKESMTGTAGQKRLPTDYFATRAFPLPPLEEQTRIVAKVDELMALCDKLEAQQQEHRKLQNALRQSTLRAVSSAESPHELQDSWARLEANFEQLFSAPEDVDELRNLVLDLSIHGLLSEKDDNDESVELFTERCISGKSDRLSAGKMKRKAAKATDVTQLDINLPEHWQRIPLDALFQFIDYRGKTPPKTSSGVTLITAKNVRSGQLNKDPKEYISEESYRVWMTRGYPRIGDLLFTTEAPLGNVALIENDPKFALAQRIIDLQPFADLNTRCAMNFMLSPTFQKLLIDNSTGMTAKGIKAAKLKQLELPIPPLEEQDRIVDRVEKLMHICGALESQLHQTKELSDRLASTAVAALTGISTEQEEEKPVKAPQTELISPLRLGQTPDIKSRAPLATLLARHSGEMMAKDLWQRFGGEIDAFYAQLKTEVYHGWIQEPAPAEMREVFAEGAGV